MEEVPAMHFEVYRDKTKGGSLLRWRLVVDQNGKVIADSGESYTTHRALNHGIYLVSMTRETPVRYAPGAAPKKAKKK